MTRVRLTLAATGLLTVAAIPVRRALLRWGATDDETTTQLSGDEFLPGADLTATRAITVRRPPEDVWPWLAQLGQRHGGFYSYDFLENLIGCGIHSADSIVAEWQSVDVGDQVDLAPGVGLTVAKVEPGRSLVLRGAPPIPGRPAPFDFTWAFTLRDGSDGRTRLIARERYAYLTRWMPLLVEPVELISAVMSRKMLRGIRDRAEAAPSRRRGAPRVRGPAASASPRFAHSDDSSASDRNAVARFENEGGRVVPMTDTSTFTAALPGSR